MPSTDDRLQITEVLSLLGQIVDGAHLDRLGEVVTPDVVYDLADAGVGVFEGIEAVRAAFTALGARAPLAHHVTNVVLAPVGPDEVAVRSKGLMIMADGSILSVDHVDAVRRHDGRWRIAHRVVTSLATGRAA
ncbi:nuclear transport factor 2 family protein [Pseudonocardia broussonetiae]|uniref:SnoaL-like domain-containing protein n=1 Tax=Pseudonocardia broussonetiae TaxID=2736640 RepID=A0A6M6JL20_9PSEU|nr:nuclear transport factor 2 family protein [Pseudonocardia broussonetiae]QJY48046.1 SnoaL-like domain-containing protein [Pseudonocardia broussonetiae]